MIDLEKPYFIVEGQEANFPSLQLGDLDRDRSAEYRQLFYPESGNPHAPVLCLTVFTEREGEIDEILVAVRDPDSNAIHPNVVSTPTMRIDPRHFLTVVEEQRCELRDQSEVKHTFELDGKDWLLPRTSRDCVDPLLLQNLVEELFYIKLGLPNGLAYYEHSGFRAAVHSISLGNSRAGVTDEWEDIIEKVAMLNILVRVPQDLKNIAPTSTHDYSDIRWVKPEDYRDMQDNKNLLPVFELNSAWLCIHGVCIATSRTALDDMQGFLSSKT